MSSSLNILCSICTEFYKETDVICSTYCGHLYHRYCIYNWLDQASTCPQCLRACNKFRLHRVYLNFNEPTGEDLEDNQLDAIDTKPIWIPIQDDQLGHVPEDAIKSGTDPDGNDTYVARVYFKYDLLPALFVPKLGGVYTPWGCNAHFLNTNIELLINCKNPEWVADTNGHVPGNAIACGYSEIGDPLYTGRAQYEGITIGGKIHPSHNRMYIAYKGKEVNTQDYEVLIAENAPLTYFRQSRNIQLYDDI